MSLTNDQTTAKNFKEFYDRIYPYLSPMPTMGYTPVGSVIAMMSTNAPQNYLKCDGTAYSIVAYPELANHFEKEFGSKNFFGGDGTTTFAVPDLRGEFLRGTGTNSHTNQGSGANVGTHQDGTRVPTALGSYVGSNQFLFNSTSKSDNYDVYVGTSVNQLASATRNSDTYYAGLVTPRPTNTSVLYCIATKDIYVDARFDYSLSEKVVGTWIDGKSIYQKTLSTNKSFVTTNPAWINEIVDVSGLNINKLIDVKIIDSVGTLICPFVLHRINNGFLSGYYALSGIGNQVLQSVTLQYTKTTD